MDVSHIVSGIRVPLLLDITLPLCRDVVDHISSIHSEVQSSRASLLDLQQLPPRDCIKNLMSLKSIDYRVGAVKMAISVLRCIELFNFRSRIV